MNPSHHPDASLLIEYATGALARGARRVVGAHVDVCGVCRRDVAEAETIGGALLAAMPPAAMHPDALSLALARIERPVPPAAHPAPMRSDWIIVPDEILRAAAERRRWAAPGVWVAPVDVGPGAARSYLLRVGAGMAVPRHTHKGSEMVLVLKGAYSDRGATLGPGDFACSDDEVDHQPRITDDGECVCLVAAEAPLVPRDWVGRLFQPFVGI